MSNPMQMPEQWRKVVQVASLLAATISPLDPLAHATLPPPPAAAKQTLDDGPHEGQPPEYKVESFYADPIRKAPSVKPYDKYPAVEMLTQVAERMKNWRTYEDPATTLHENIHLLHGHLHDTYGERPEYRDDEVRYENGERITSNAVQPIWLGEGNVAMVKDPDSLVLDDILPYVPESLRRSRTRVYLQNDKHHRETNILNEHAAYLLDGEYSIKIHDYIWKRFRNDSSKHIIDAVDGAAEFIPYSLALAQAIESTSDNYKTPEEQKQALAVIKLLCERSAAAYKEALNTERYPMFTATKRDYLSNLRDNEDAKSLRDFAIKTYGEEWFNNLVN